MYTYHASRMEEDRSEEAVQALRNLVLLVGSLTTCGFIELKPSSSTSSTLFQMPGFVLPQPSGKGKLSCLTLSELEEVKKTFPIPCKLPFKYWCFV